MRREVDALLQQSDDNFLRSVAAVPDLIAPMRPMSICRPARASIATSSSIGSAKAAWARWLATDTDLHRKVAVKCLTARESEKALRRKLLDEARTAGRLNHPHIATVYDVVEHDARTYLVMEFVEGDSLANELRRERMPLPRTLAIGRELASALSAAHGKGVVHRDLKPANIQVMRSGSVKVLDFGIAQAMSLLTSESEWPSGVAGIETKTRAVLNQARRRTCRPNSFTAAESIIGRTSTVSASSSTMTAGHRPFASTDPLELIALLSRRLFRPDQTSGFRRRS